MKFLEKDEIKNPSVTYTELVVVSIAERSTFLTSVGRPEGSDPMIKADLAGGAIRDNRKI